MSSCLTGSETGLKLYNKFENGTGSTATSAVGPNGTLVNMTPATNWVTGSGSECCTPASALNFDGANDVVSLPNGLPSMADMTIEGWIYPESISNFNVILNNSNWYTGLVHFQLRPSGELGFAINGNSPPDQNTSMVFTPNQWYHIAAVYSSTNQYLKFYVNGVLVDTYAYTTAIATAANAQFEIGGWDGQRFFDGTMDELRIWNTTRTECEINTYMNCEIPTTATGLVANYHFNQGVDAGSNSTITPLTDASGNANDGTLNNFSLNGTTSNWIAPGAVANGYTTTTVCTMASALNFDGSNDYVSLNPINITGNSARTVEFWIKTSNTGNFQNPFSSGNANTNEAFNIKVTSSGHLGFMGFFNDYYPSSGTIIADNTFHHVALTYDGTTVAAYIDGNHEWDFAVNLNTTGENNFIGQSNHINNEQYFAGTLDELRIWNVVRTRCELISYKNCEIPTTVPGLVANYHFNQGVDMMSNPIITTLTDASGNAINGTLSNFALSGTTSNWVAPGAVVSGFSTPIVCPLASALNFDGNDRINVGGGLSAILDPLNMITVEAWVNPSTTSGLGVIVGNYATYNTDMQFLLRRDGDQYAFWVSEGSGFQVVNSGSLTVLPNTWQHVAGVWDGSELRIYIDGVLKATTTGVTGSSFENVSNPVMIGYNNMNENFSGSIDEIRMWTTARSQCEINTYKDCEIPGTSSGLLLNYHFNQGLASFSNPTETSLTDVSGNGYNGALNGFGLTGATSNWVAPGGVVSGYTTSIAPLVVGSVTTNSVFCSGGSTTLNGTGADTYSWSNGVVDGVAFMPTTTMTYSVTGTNTLSTCFNMASITITVNALPAITVNSGAICVGQSFTMTPAGADTYTYSGGTNVVTPTADETYSVSGTDANGCISSTDAISSVTVNALPAIMATTTNTLLCTGETATLSATGATSYTWSTTETTMDIVIAPTTQTTYTVEGTDANGCSNTTTITQDVSLCTGIAALSNNDLSMSVYPNPNNGIFSVQVASVTKLTVINALGEIVLSETMEAGKHTLTIQDQSAGIYFVKAIQNNKQQIIKLIKQ